MTQKVSQFPMPVTFMANQSHIEMINRAAGSGKVNYSAAIRYAIEQTYGEYVQKKVG